MIVASIKTGWSGLYSIHYKSRGANKWWKSIVLFYFIILFFYFLADTELAPCSVSHLLQFHDRYLAYLIAAREQEMYPDFQVETWAYEDREEIIAVNVIPFSSCVRPSA